MDVIILIALFSAKNDQRFCSFLDSWDGVFVQGILDLFDFVIWIDEKNDFVNISVLRVLLKKVFGFFIQKKATCM